MISSINSLRHSTCTVVKRKLFSSAPFYCSGSSSLRKRMPTTSRSPTMPPRALHRARLRRLKELETTPSGRFDHPDPRADKNDSERSDGTYDR